MTNSSTINTNSQANLQNTQLHEDVNSGKIDIAGLNVTSPGISEQGVVIPPVTSTVFSAMTDEQKLLFAAPPTEAEVTAMVEHARKVYVEDINAVIRESFPSNTKV
jgi:hypothetical protein